MEDQPRAHAVADERRRPVAVGALHQHVRQQPPRLPDSKLQGSATQLLPGSKPKSSNLQELEPRRI